MQTTLNLSPSILIEPANNSVTTQTKSKASFSLMNAFSRSKQGNKHSSLSVKEKYNANISKSSENNSTIRSNLMNSLSPTRISYLTVSQQSNQSSVANNDSALFLIPGSISSSDLQCSTSSLLAFAATNSTDDEGLKNLEDFHHVSDLYFLSFFFVIKCKL